MGILVLPRTERGNKRREMSLRRKMLSVFLCNRKSEKCPEGGARKAAGGTALNRDKESELEVIMGGALATTGELVLGGTLGHQRSR